MAHQAGSAADLERLMEEYGTGLLRLCALHLGDAALAEDVKEIFAEIYNDPEHFPIHDVGGYAWRGDSATGEHNCGTAIDINANENYQIRDGQVLAGSCWEPGSNAYSISPDSSVVRIFAEHGWSWGGDAWAYSSDDSEGYHDYMHFSYMGE